MTLDAAFTNFPVLTTERLQLRQMQPTDLDAFFAIRSDVASSHAFGVEPHQSIEDTRAWMGRVQSVYEKWDGLYWCTTLKGEDTVIGSCCFWNWDLDSHCAELGYQLLPAYQHRGIMAETIAAILDYGFTTLDLHRVEACVLDENTPSKNLLLKLGFTCEGNLRQRQLFRADFKDQLYFGLLKDEWRKST